MNTIPKATFLLNIFSTFVSPIYTFSMSESTIVHTPIQITNGEKYLNHIFLKKGKYRRCRELNTSPSISSFIDRVLCILRQKNVRVRFIRNGHQSGYFRVDTLDISINERSKVFP